MAAKKTNLSAYSKNTIPSAKGMKIAVVVSSWNEEITEALFIGARKALIDNGCLEKDILRYDVPGSFELPSGAQYAAENKNPDAVICLGCVIQGETRHFEFICNAVANGLIQLNLRYQIPFIFGVLTPDTMEQARARAGGRHGNKGVEAAVTAIQMVMLKKSVKK